MKSLGILIGCAIAAWAASNDTFVIRNADVYPVTGAEMKGVSVLIQDGKIADIGPKIVAPKGMRVVDAKGLRRCASLWTRASWASSCRSSARWSR